VCRVLQHVAVCTGSGARCSVLQCVLHYDAVSSMACVCVCVRARVRARVCVLCTRACTYIWAGIRNEPLVYTGLVYTYIDTSPYIHTDTHTHTHTHLYTPAQEALSLISSNAGTRAARVGQIMSSYRLWSTSWCVCERV